MSWIKRKRTYKGQTENYSLVRKLKKRKEEKKQKRILENTSKRNMGRLDG